MNEIESVALCRQRGSVRKRIIAIVLVFYGGKSTVASSNHLARQFNVSEPDKSWMTDITYIRTYKMRLY